MINNNSLLFKHLNGTEFSSAYKFKLPEKYSETKREQLLKKISKQKRVIHLGCLDHIPLIDQKIKNNTWLHKLISDESEMCLGIDINKPGVEIVKDKYRIENIIYANILSDDIPEITNKPKWDYIILGEILEHTNNPVDFLKTIKDKYKSNISKIILTVPNVLNYHSFNSIKKCSEIINTDHRYWFTPYTILKVLHEAGYKVQDVQFANRIPLNNWQLTKRKIKLFINKKVKYTFPYFNTIIVTASL